MVSSISPVMQSDPARIHNWLSLMPSLRLRHRSALCYNKTKETEDTQPIFWTNMLFTKKSLLTWFVPVNFPNQTVISQPKPWWPNCYFPPQTLMLTWYFTWWEKKNIAWSAISSNLPDISWETMNHMILWRTPPRKYAHGTYHLCCQFIFLKTKLTNS